VVLQDVADRAHLVVEPSPPSDAEGLGHGDLDAVDVVAVPDRLQEGVGEAEVKEVLHRLLAQVVIDPEHGVLVEDLVDGPIQRPGRGQVPSERLLHDQPGPVAHPQPPQALDHGGKQTRRNGEVVKRP